MNLRLGSLMLFAPDLPVAKAFYSEVLGLPLVAETDRRLTFRVSRFDLDIFRCEKDGAVGDYANEPRAVFVFAVEDIASTLTELRERGVRVLHSEPVEAEGVRYAAFADPFGNVHELAQRV